LRPRCNTSTRNSRGVAEVLVVGVADVAGYADPPKKLTSSARLQAKERIREARLRTKQAKRPSERSQQGEANTSGRERRAQEISDSAEPR
jgi:hypothetical protein